MSFVVVSQCSLCRKIDDLDTPPIVPRSSSHPFQAFDLDASTKSIRPKSEAEANIWYKLCRLDRLVLVCGKRRQHSQYSRDVWVTVI